MKKSHEKTHGFNTFDHDYSVIFLGLEDIV